MLYGALRRARVRSIVEIGLQKGLRSTRLIETAMRYHPPGRVQYTGIDLFEARPPGSSGIPLKAAHCLLCSLGGRVGLVPGDPFTALARKANSLTGTDMIVISADQEPASLARAWFYVPRMLHDRSLVFLEEAPAGDAESTFRLLTHEEIEALAVGESIEHRRAA